MLSILRTSNSRAEIADAYVTCFGLFVRCVPRLLSPAVVYCPPEASLVGLVGLKNV